MKKIIYIYMLFATLFVSCDEWLDVNQDPNNPTEIGPDLSLPVAQFYTAYWLANDRRVSHLGNIFMVNWSESAGFSWYDTEFLYQANSTFYNRIFDDAYRLNMKQFTDIEGKGDDYLAYDAISMIMKAYTFQILVDFYGDIPYFDALKRSDVATPAYDNAQAIYDDLIVQLSAAQDLLDQAEANTNSVLPEDDDVMFGGDLLMWKQFANSVKLRILTRENQVKDAGYITTELAAIAEEGSGYITADVEINPGFTQQQNQQSPLWESFGADETGAEPLSGQATCASEFMINYLTDTSDPRIDFLFEEPATGHLGVPQGITSTQDVYAPALVSNLGPGLLIGPSQGTKVMTVAEVMFNLAELALNNFGGDAEALYEAGVQASFNTLGAGDASVYLSQNIENIGYDASSNKLAAIINQKWLAMQGINAEQSWFDHSRTGFPDNIPISVEAPNLVRPVRLAYPASELSQNSENIPDQPNVYTAKIFWAN